MEPSWELYGTFLQVMREGSLSGAARVLQVAQPTVRRRVEALEEQLGATLFARAPNGLIATEAAHTLLPFATTMEATARASVRSLADVDAVAGTVRLTTSEVMGVEVVPGLLEPLLRSHPGLQIELALSDGNEDLQRRDADVAIRMARPRGSMLVARKAGTVRLGFFATAGYLARRGTPGALGDLQAHALVGYDRNPRLREALGAMGVTLDVERFVLRTDRDPAMLAAIRGGLGIGVCQVPLAARTGLVRVLPGFGFDLEIWVVAHQDLKDIRRIRVVLDHLHAALAAYAQ